VPRMLEEFRYILSEIKVALDPKWGACVELIDYEHRDYIEDVMIEVFDTEYSFTSHDEITGKYSLYFEKNASFEQVSKVVEQINEYHKKYNVEFVLPSGT
jgi:hypothetical protein